MLLVEHDYMIDEFAPGGLSVLNIPPRRPL